MANKHATLSDLFTAIANAIRGKTGSTDTIVADNFPDAIGAISTDGDFGEATLTSGGSLLKDVKAYGANGTLYTGTIETRTSNDITSDGAKTTIPAGYYATSLERTGVTAEQATPVLSIDTTNNCVKATCTQGTGYVSGGTKTGTYGFTKVGTNYYTPTAGQQTLFNSGLYYFTGNQYLNGSSGPTVEWLSSGDVSSTANSVVINTSNTIGTLHGFALVYTANYDGTYGLYSIVGDESTAELNLRAGDNNESSTKTVDVSGSSITIRDSGLHYYYTTSCCSCLVIYTPA